MSELALNFQTEPGQATPRLKPRAGSAVPWNEEDLREREASLARQYTDLIRGKVDTVMFHARPLRVTVRDDKDKTRLPVVLLTDLPAASRSENPSAPVLGWLEGLLAEVETLGGAVAVPLLDPLEQGMLRYVEDELRGLAGRIGSGEAAGLLLAGHLAAAEQLARSTEPERATVYALALRGLDKPWPEPGWGKRARLAGPDGV